MAGALASEKLRESVLAKYSLATVVVPCAASQTRIAGAVAEIIAGIADESDLAAVRSHVEATGGNGRIGGIGVDPGVSAQSWHGTAAGPQWNRHLAQPRNR